jgi:hypothetical protein
MDWWLLVSYVGVFAVGGLIGYKINDYLIRSTFNEMLEQAGITDRHLDKFVEHWAPIMEGEEVSQGLPQVQIRIEKIGDQIMCYEKATDRFLGQARSRDELIEVLTSRLGPVALLIQPEDGADLVNETSN